MSNNQNMMPLSEKDLSYLKDQLTWELVASKKAFQYAHQTLEPECRQLMFQVSQQHQKNLERIVEHLGTHVSQTVQASVTGAQPVTTHI